MFEVMVMKKTNLVIFNRCLRPPLHCQQNLFQAGVFLVISIF